MRNKATFSGTHKENKKRGIAKAKRGKGIFAIPKEMTLNEWCQKHDPLFHIKGIERHRRLHEN